MGEYYFMGNRRIFASLDIEPDKDLKKITGTVDIECSEAVPPSIRGRLNQLKEVYPVLNKLKFIDAYLQAVPRHFVVKDREGVVVILRRPDRGQFSQDEDYLKWFLNRRDYALVSNEVVRKHLVYPLYMPESSPYFSAVLLVTGESSVGCNSMCTFDEYVPLKDGKMSSIVEEQTHLAYHLMLAEKGLSLDLSHPKMIYETGIYDRCATLYRIVMLYPSIARRAFEVVANEDKPILYPYPLGCEIREIQLDKIEMMEKKSEIEVIGDNIHSHGVKDDNKCGNELCTGVFVSPKRAFSDVIWNGDEYNSRFLSEMVYEVETCVRKGKVEEPKVVVHEMDPRINLDLDPSKRNDLMEYEKMKSPWNLEKISSPITIAGIDTSTRELRSTPIDQYLASWIQAGRHEAMSKLVDKMVSCELTKTSEWREGDYVLHVSYSPDNASVQFTRREGGKLYSTNGTSRKDEDTYYTVGNTVSHVAGGSVFAKRIKEMTQDTTYEEGKSEVCIVSVGGERRIKYCVAPLRKCDLSVAVYVLVTLIHQAMPRYLDYFTRKWRDVMCVCSFNAALYGGNTETCEGVCIKKVAERVKQGIGTPKFQRIVRQLLGGKDPKELNKK